MSAYTPTEARARDLYSWAYAWRTEDAEGETDLSELRASQRAEFDRMIAQVKAEAQVEALREARRAVAAEQSAAFHDGIRRVEFMLGVTEVLTALDYRADRIAREAGIETKEATDG